MSSSRNSNSEWSVLAHAWQSARTFIASERLRRLRSVLFQIYVLIAALLFAGLALLANTTPVFGPDVAITRELQSEAPGWFGMLLEAVSVPGYVIESVVIVLGVVIYLAVIGLHWESASALFAAFSSIAINFMIKGVVQRPRPSADIVNVFQRLSDFSFPSGHVMFYTGFFGFLLFLTFTLLKRTWRRFFLLTLFTLLIGLIGTSRMYLGEHWASDVLGGYLGGSLTLILSIMFYRWGKERRLVQQPVAVTGSETSQVPLPPDEQKEVHEALKNPLLTKTEAHKALHPETDDHHPDRA